MSHPYKELFERVNASRNKRGLKVITWKEFLTKDEEIPKPRVIKQYRQQLKDAPPMPIKRAPAQYDNYSPRRKYGLE